MLERTRFEDVLFSNLINNELYARKVIPFLKPDYFESRPDRLIFEEIDKYFVKYNKCPDIKTLSIEAEDFKVSQDEQDAIQETIVNLTERSNNFEWLMRKTEKFCKDRSIYLAIMKSISILDGRDKNHSTDVLPQLLAEAIAVNFDKSVGHDYFEDAENRYDFFHAEENRLRFGLEMFNKITGGGMKRKTLSCILGGTGFGKSAFLCDLSASILKQGKNVLYITLEMSAEEISNRIDCNLLDVSIRDIHKIEKDAFISKINSLHKRNQGKLIVKEYPTGSAHAGHFKSLLEELKTKKNFIPDLICIDYLNICCSQRYKAGTSANSYTIVKSIAEEVRGLAIEYNVPIWTGTQSRREANIASDMDITDVSESFGLPATLDFFIGGVRTPELDDLGQIMFIQLKSRLGDINYFRKFIVGVEIDKFKFYDVDNTYEKLANSGYKEEKTQPDIPMFDKSKRLNTDFNFE